MASSGSSKDIYPVAVPNPNMHEHDASLKERIEELWERGKKEEEEVQKQEGDKYLNWAFEKIPVSLFPRVHRVVEIPSDSSVGMALAELAKRNILSAPVWDVLVGEDKSWIDRYLGVVDMHGIVFWLLQYLDEIAKTSEAASAASGSVLSAAATAAGAAALGATGVGAAATVAAAALGGAAAGATISHAGPTASGESLAGYLAGDVFEALKSNGVLDTTKVADIAGTFRWAPFLPVTPDDSLLTLLLLMSKYRVRSIPVVEPGKGPVTNIITQYSVVNLFAGCTGQPWFDAVASRSLRDLGLPVTPVEKIIMVEEGESVLVPFRKMVENHIGGLPVVAAGTKRVIANLSVRDIWPLLADPGLFKQRKMLSVADYVEGAKVSKVVGNLTTALMSPPVPCRSSSHLVDVIKKLKVSHIHRIYVTDDDHNLEGVLTLRDIIGIFVTEPAGYFGDFFGGVAPNVHPQAKQGIMEE